MASTGGHDTRRPRCRGRSPLDYDRAIATFALIHGAGDVGWYWHLVAAELEQRGHVAVAPDLPCEDESAGWSDYADAVVDAIGECRDLVVVGQSLGGYTAPLVCERVPVELMVLVAAMVPLPGETLEEWWENTGYADVSRGSGASEEKAEGIEAEIATFYHDVPRALAEEALRHGRGQADLGDPWPLQAWPDVPTRFIVCRDDRVFPAVWLSEVVRERLGIEPEVMDSAHTPALSNPTELADRLEAYLKEK